MNVLYLSQDFLGINFEMAFQRTDYDFVCLIWFVKDIPALYCL